MRSLEGFVRVLRGGDLPAREGLDTRILAVRLGRERVLLARRGNGEVVAFGAFCPHEMTDLQGATIVDGNVRCLKHNYIYDPCSGENIVPAQVARPENLWKLKPGFLPTHTVVERDGWIWVSEKPNPPPASWDPSKQHRPVGATVASDPVAPEPAPPPAPPAPLEHPAKTLRVHQGAQFELRLPIVVRPGHIWKVAAPSGLLEVVQERFEAGTLDSPPRQRIRLSALSVGQGTVRCSYGRPWDEEAAEVRTYVVQVVP